MVHGTAIGTRLTPTFAGLFIFMGDLETDIMQAWSEQGPDCVPEDWWRFIDNILFWWLGKPGQESSFSIL